MATALGVAPSTVQAWKGSGFIPARRQQAVLDAARALKIPLTPEDFFAAGTPAPEPPPGPLLGSAGETPGPISPISQGSTAN